MSYQLSVFSYQFLSYQLPASREYVANLTTLVQVSDLNAICFASLQTLESDHCLPTMR